MESATAQSRSDRVDPAQLTETSSRAAITHTLEAVRGVLTMDVAFATEFVDGQQVCRYLDGDGASFGLAEGSSTPLGLTYCRRVLTGRLPNLMPDVRTNPRAALLPITESAGIRAFASAPLNFSDGRLYGTICAASRDPRPGLGYRELQFLHHFAGILAAQLEREATHEAVHRHACEEAVSEALIAAVRARDAYTADHSTEVVGLAAAVARRLGLSDPEAADVARVAMLHDVGKISVPDSILSKPGPLTEEEWTIMRMHPVYGEELVASIPGLEHLAGAVRAEHERWDGSGYPDGIAGEEIPLASRITLACDAYHAMITDRPYRRAHSREEAWGELMLHAGSQFDPTVVEALLLTLADEDAGQLPGAIGGGSLFNPAG